MDEHWTIHAADDLVNLQQESCSKGVENNSQWSTCIFCTYSKESNNILKIAIGGICLMF